ncbi:MAG: hypothetical protein RMA76_38775 [Deltaproteobacteria bacterium]
MSSRSFVLAFVAIWVLLLAQATAFESPYFRPYEVVVDPRGIRFLPSMAVEMDEYGVLSFNQHTPELRVTRSTRFTTDRWGFRNLPMGRARVVVIGDSFVLGAGASDDETFPYFLGQELGEPVYNYGAQKSWGAPYFLRDPRFVEYPPQLVLWMPSQMRLKPIPELPTATPSSPRPGTEPSGLSVAYAKWQSVGAPLVRARASANRDNGLRMLFAEHFQRLRRAAFGHPGLIEVDGASALAMTPKAQLLMKSPEDRRIDDVVATFVDLRDALAQRNIGFLFVPIPGQAEVYLDAFPPELREGAFVEPSMRELVLERMRQEGTAVLDLGPAFSDASLPYLWWRDDTHWTPVAAQVAARQVSEYLRAHPEVRGSAD